MASDEPHWLRFARVGWWVALVLWTLALLMPIPGFGVQVVGGPDNSFWVSKVLHLSAYAALTMSALTAFRRSPISLILCGLMMHGAASEFGQRFTGRGASVRDALLDACGVLLGLGLWWGGRRLLGDSSRVFPQVQPKHNSADQNQDAPHL